MHISPSQLRQYLDGSLEPAQLLAVDDHLALCPSCRSQLLAPLDSLAATSTLLSTLTPPAPHPTSAELTAFIDQRLAPPQRAALASHFAECPACQAELDDLRLFASSLRPQPQPHSARRSWALPAYAAAAAVLLALALRTPIATPPAAPTLTATIADGPLTLGRAAEGDWRLLTNALAPADRAALLAAATSGRLPLTTDPALSTTSSQLLGSSQNLSDSWRLLEPVDEPSLDAHPTFTWDALPGDWTYQVEIYDREYRRVASSGHLLTNAWRISTDLPAGAVYSWQVIATGPSGQLRKTPQAPAPEARFRILTPADRERILLARRSGSNLLLAVRYAELGLRRQAAIELDRLRSRNPNNPLLVQLSQPFIGN